MRLPGNALIREPCSLSANRLASFYPAWAMMGAMLSALGWWSPPAAHAQLSINETYAHMTGTDTAEFVELFGPPGSVLDGLVLVVIDGDGPSRGLIINVEALAGTLPPDGLWVMGQSTTPNPDPGNPPDQVLTAALQNGTQTYLLLSAFTGNLGDDVDTDDNGFADAGYAGIATADIRDSVAVADTGLADATYYAAPTLGPTVFGTPAGVARLADGMDTNTADDWQITSYYLIPPQQGVDIYGYPAASPGLHNGDVNNCPVAHDGARSLPADWLEGITITLDAFDDGEPYGQLTYRIETLPTLGRLEDLNNQHIINSLPYELTGGGNQVQYLPSNQAGSDSFTFSAHDGYCRSDPHGTVTVTVDPRRPDRVVITEIMFDAPNADAGWEWVEVTNITAVPVTLASLLDENRTLSHHGNLQNYTLGAYETVILTEQKDSFPSLTNFLIEWTPLTGEHIVQAPHWPALNNDEDTLILVDDGGYMLDTVHYRNDAGGWPDVANGPSIYLTYGHLSPDDNDDGNHWAASADGIDHAYETSAGHVGSPALLPTGCCPEPQDQQVQVYKNADPGPVITLLASDCDTPAENLSFEIAIGPAVGTLTDPLNGEQDVTAGGPLTGNQVRFTPPAETVGTFVFEFQVTDGQCVSVPGEIQLEVIDPGGPAEGIVITEIMHNPIGRTETAWEWIEIVNLSDDDVALRTLEDAEGQQEGNLDGRLIPPGAVWILTPRKSQDEEPTLDTFLANWPDLSADQVLEVDDWPALANTLSQTIRLIALNGVILDEISYHAGFDGWPASSDAHSMYLGGCALSPEDNNDGDAWLVAVPGTDGVTESGRGDMGSPGELPICVEPCTRPVLLTAESVRIHGDAGEFSIDLMNPGAMETRDPNGLNLRMTYDVPIRLISVPDVSAGQVAHTSFAGSTLQITMTGTHSPHALNVRYAVIHHDDASCMTIESLCVPLLHGKSTPNAAVPMITTFDLLAVRNHLTHAVDATNFHTDFDADGRFTVFDMFAVRNHLNDIVDDCP